MRACTPHGLVHVPVISLGHYHLQMVRYAIIAASWSEAKTRRSSTRQAKVTSFLRLSVCYVIVIIGVTATLSAGMRRAILRSPAFQLSSSAELRFEASLSTFGARLYICPDVETANTLENCELVLGPKVERKKLERILVQLDTDIRQFVFVAVHDKFLQFGDAEVLLSRVQLTDANGNLIC